MSSGDLTPLQTRDAVCVYIFICIAFSKKRDSMGKKSMLQPAASPLVHYLQAENKCAYEEVTPVLKESFP